MKDDLDRLAQLRDLGVAAATFHENGELASVSFAPNASLSDERQHETSDPVKRPERKPTGGLVPRERSADRS